MKEKEKHEIVFRNTENSWDSALPVGNGRLGAMVFFEEGRLHIALNHYDCYYRLLPKLQKETGDPEQSLATFPDPARFWETYEELCGRVDEARAVGDTARRHYARMLHPITELKRPAYRGASYPLGGEFVLDLDARVNTAHSCLKLSVEEAKIMFEAGCEESVVSAEIIAARKPDGVLVRLSQSEEGLWKEGRWLYDSDHGGAQRCEAMMSAQKLSLAFSLQPGVESTASELLEKDEEIRREHEAYWRQFWRSTVTLPDKFLERLWHLQLYLLECSSAKGSNYPEQSWGLSGLWDIRRPNMWGSLWYWDVNIQSAFWGVHTAGHPELLKLFCDGYLAYEEDIRAYTRQVYKKEGWALDYPHTLYNCIQPWCAQFLWLYYQYSLDLIFLREKAYPVFVEQIAFFKGIAKQDTQGILHIEYDISPEQGPVTADSVITVACVKELLRMAIEAAIILGKSEDVKEFGNILTHLPAYPRTAEGSRFKDSYLAQDNLFLRHPSMLMPIFPTGEIDFEAEGEKRRMWENTLRFAAEHTETGTFGMGWLAAAAARLGLGREALRLLYERGLDYVLHENGLAYEESKGFINYCHLTKPAHYLPVMMESAGGILNVVNMMLLQNTAEGVLHVFPALPKANRKGKDLDIASNNVGILPDSAQYLEDAGAFLGDYEVWADVSFSGFRTPGGFVVSAEQKDECVTFIKIESTKDAVLKLWLPQELSGNKEDKEERGRVIERQMRAGETVCFGKAAEDGLQETAREQASPREQTQLEVLCHHAARTHRRIFLGADCHTKYFQAIDAFVCPYLFGNELQYRMTPYVFDFGAEESDRDVETDYENAYPVQSIRSGQCVLYCGGPRRVEALPYTPEKRYGFLSTEGIRAMGRKGPDDLRRSFLEGEGEVIFALDLPKGKYDLLIISGDEEEASYTECSLAKQETKIDTGILLPGRFAAKMLPVVQERDGELLIRIASKKGYCWKLNAMFVNKEWGG